VDGITVDNRPGRPVIAADAKDDKFYAAMFSDDDEAVFDMGTDELEQARAQYRALPSWEPKLLTAWHRHVIGDGPVPRKPGPHRSNQAA
jgi:hypothetical protein